MAKQTQQSTGRLTKGMPDGITAEKQKQKLIDGTVLLSLSLIRQDRNLSSIHRRCRKLRRIISHRSHLSRHRTDAQVALQQSLILQDDGQKIIGDTFEVKE